jgi:hypothetical protein
MTESSSLVMMWWAGMSAIAVLNVGLWFYARSLAQKRSTGYSDEIAKIKNLQIVLTGVFVFVCGFRSIVPRLDVLRLTLIDSFISSVVVGRSLATVAELCFCAQWALILWEMGRSLRNSTLMSMSRVIVPMLAVAEVFSWYACLTTNFLGSVIEESLWGTAAAIAVIGFWIGRSHYSGPQRRFLNTVIVCFTGYVIYMATVDVPNYIRGYLKAEAAGRIYTPVLEGFREVATQWSVTRSYEDWQYGMVWMTLYFSIAVWGSLLIALAPRLDQTITRADG